jgi:Zinc carboxypeptidase
MNSRLASHLAILLTLTGSSLFGGPASAKDSFNLDRFKLPAEAITKPDQPYRTRFGSPISVYSIDHPSLNSDHKNPALRFLVQGGLHGNELLGSEFVSWLAQRFAKGESLLNALNGGNVTIDFVPYANPDGTIQYTRVNGNKINLNRNFGVLWGLTKENPGPSAFSEPETRAIRDLFAKQNYTGAIDVHGYINWVVIPTSPEDGMTKGLPKADANKLKAYRRWAQAVKNEAAARLPGYEVKTAGGLGDGGAFEDFAWWGAGVPAACLEIFSTDRFVAQSMAAKIVEILTPKAFGHVASNFDSSDMFLVYENYIHSLFLEAIHIKSGDEPIQQMAGTAPAR